MRLAALHGGTCGKGRPPFFPREPPPGLRTTQKQGHAQPPGPPAPGPGQTLRHWLTVPRPSPHPLHRGRAHPAHGHRGHGAEPPAGPVALCGTDCGARRGQRPPGRDLKQQGQSAPSRSFGAVTGRVARKRLPVSGESRAVATLHRVPSLSRARPRTEAPLQESGPSLNLRPPREMPAGQGRHVAWPCGRRHEQMAFGGPSREGTPGPSASQPSAGPGTSDPPEKAALRSQPSRPPRRGGGRHQNNGRRLASALARSYVQRLPRSLESGSGTSVHRNSSKVSTGRVFRTFRFQQSTFLRRFITSKAQGT